MCSRWGPLGDRGAGRLQVRGLPGQRRGRGSDNGRACSCRMPAGSSPCGAPISEKANFPSTALFFPLLSVRRLWPLSSWRVPDINMLQTNEGTRQEKGAQHRGSLAGGPAWRAGQCRCGSGAGLPHPSCPSLVLICLTASSHRPLLFFPPLCTGFLGSRPRRPRLPTSLGRALRVAPNSRARLHASPDGRRRV